ncbi:MAG TPA: regulatory protein RecX [Dactylosporangium sp.]|nr:regulatory protein RecX [Dactylosporangium sp.]
MTRAASASESDDPWIAAVDAGRSTYSARRPVSAAADDLGDPLADKSEISGMGGDEGKRGRRGARGRGRERRDPASATSAPSPSPSLPSSLPSSSTTRAGASAPSDPREVAREICLRQLAVRPRTRAELATAMRKRGVEDEIAAEILDRYDEVGIIDDAAFARAWVASRHHGRGLARRALAGELRRKGVSPDEVGEALEELAPDVEEATARALVARRLRGETRGTPEAVFRRLVGMLGRKGYPPGLAIRIVKDAMAEREDAAEFADGIDADALADAALDPDNQ